MTEAAALNQHETIQRFIQVGSCGSITHAVCAQQAYSAACLLIRCGPPAVGHMMPGVLPPHLVATPAAPAPLQGTIAEGAPVVPISAQLKYNVDAVRLGDWSVCSLER